jgi:hypothetical protein
MKTEIFGKKLFRHEHHEKNQHVPDQFQDYILAADKLAKLSNAIVNDLRNDAEVLDQIEHVEPSGKRAQSPEDGKVDVNQYSINSKSYSNTLSFEKGISVHIFSVSAALIGICLTGVGIIHNFTFGTHIKTMADDFLSLDSLLFLAACFLSYWALRSRGFKRAHKIEKFADGAFLVGLCLLATSCFLITYAIT